MKSKNEKKLKHKLLQLKMLDGYENLAKTATVKVGSDTDVKLVNDLNLETKLTQCSAGSACEVELTLASNPSGIYKVTIYGPSESDDVSGWKVQLVLQAASPGSMNTATSSVDCDKDKTTSSGKDSDTFTCNTGLAATKVIVKTDSFAADKNLAEIIVAGHEWEKFPCPAGWSSKSGSYSKTVGDTCKKCDRGTYQDLSGQKFCRPSKFKQNTLTDGKFNSYQDALSLADHTLKGEVHDVVVYNINFDDYSKTAVTSGTELTSKGDCAKTLASYQGADCVLKVKNAKVKLLPAGKGEETLTTADNTGTSRRDQTYTYKPASPPEGVTKVSFTQAFHLAELLVYEAKKADYYDVYNDEEGGTGFKKCPAEKVAKSDFTECELCPGGKYRPGGTEITCKACDKGKYRKAGEANSCVDCEDGSVTTTEGLTECTKCEKGKKSNSAKDECEQCPAGEVTKTEGLAVCTKCSTEGALFAAKADQSDCISCEDGKVPKADRTTCVDCEAGKYRKGSSQTTCQDCPAPQISKTAGSAECEMCPEGQVPNSDRTECVPCKVGTYRGSGDTKCEPCEDLHFSAAGSASCTKCKLGEVPNSDKSACVKCDIGKYRGESETVCTVCQGGHHTDEKEGASACKPCDRGYETEKVSDTNDGLQCVKCKVGFISAAPGTATCTECATPNVALTTGQSECVKCEDGTGRDTSSTCKDCVAGERSKDGLCVACTSPDVTLEAKQSECVRCKGGTGWKTASTCEDCVAGKKSKDGLCVACPFNYFTAEALQTECKLCPKVKHSGEGASSCLECDKDDPEKKMTGVDELQWQKCVADLGPACIKQTVESVYGTYKDIRFMRSGADEERPCEYDSAANPVPKARFACEKVNETAAVLKPYYNCIKTNKTEGISKLGKDPVTASNVEDVSKQLEAATSAGGNNGIGDVGAAADVIENIAKATTKVSEKATENLVSSVSSLAAGDLKTEDMTQKKEISKKMVENIKQIAKKTEVSNKLVKSANVAIMKVTPESGSSTGDKKTRGISFSLPDPSDLTKMGEESAEEEKGKKPSIAIAVPGGVEMSVVMLTGDAFFPSASTAAIPTGNNEQIRESLWRDLKDDFNVTDPDAAPVKYVNSVVLEIDVGAQDPGFVLNLYIKPNFQVGDPSKSLSKVGDRRVQIRYLCAWYETDKAEWVTTGCTTTYESDSMEAGVVCSCSHNTSFAVLMAAEEIDPGYIETQSLISQILLGGSVFGLIATISLILPASAIITTRSAKVNICFSIALLIASLLFLLQDFLVKDDNSGVIQLRSIGCAVYAMLQHYMWLVVFMWTVIEGFLMYLSLVQVFGSHISHYMLKFNAVAYGVPVAFPLAGYFAFTRKVSVAGVDVVDHQYLAETMCFLKPGTINFYALFFGPLVLAILVNLVFFGLVLNVIRKSKNSNLSDRDQLLRQMKAAVGVMVLLGTGWVIGVFMTIPAPGMQITLQYLFIVINASQGMFVFVFYVVLNDAVKNFWLEKLGMKTAAPKSGGGASTATNVYANASTSKADTEHTYSSAAEFPAKKDDNANL